MIERAARSTARVLVIGMLIVVSGCAEKAVTEHQKRHSASQRAEAVVTASAAAEQPASPAKAEAKPELTEEEFDRSYAAYVRSLPDRPPGEYLQAERETVVVMAGLVEHKGWTKSAESWDAGGSDYYVLVRDDAAVPVHSNRVILRASPTFTSIDEFKPFSGKRVELRGRWAAKYKFKVPDWSQQPSFMHGEEYHVGGGGFLVDGISVLGEGIVPQDQR